MAKGREWITRIYFLYSVTPDGLEIRCGLCGTVFRERNLEVPHSEEIYELYRELTIKNQHECFRKVGAETA